MDSPGELEDIEVLSQRLDFLTYLAEEGAEKPAIVDALDHSRSTVDRAISTLEDAGFVAETDEGYATTLTGRLALERYEQFIDEAETVLEAESFLGAVPPELDMPASVVLDGDIETEVDGPWVAETVGDALSTASRCRAALCRSVDGGVLEAIRSQAKHGQFTAKILADRSVAERLTEGASETTTDGVEILRAPTPSVSLLLVTGSGETASGEDERTLLVVASDDGASSVVETTAAEAIDWAETYLENLSAGAEGGDHGVDGYGAE